jgi:hypothetical protein
MGTIMWEPTQHRLRLGGSCGEEDRPVVERTLAGLEDEQPVLIIDLPAVEALAPPVAEVIVAACDRPDDCRVSVLRRHGSQVDRVLRTLGA